MAIDVTCPGCHTRFQVSEKFAGKQGPCPKCKKVITVPSKKDEVVIHAPEVSGPTDSKGQAVLKPISRKEVRLSTTQIAIIAASVLVVLIVAVVLRIQFQGKDSQELRVLTTLGAILLGPALAYAGYTFLRDDELEPYRGTQILLRALACGLVYAATWGIFWFVFLYLNNWKNVPAPSWQIMAVVVPVMVAIGAVAAQASLDFEIGTGALHYAMYLTSTVLLRLLLGMSAHWNAEPLPPRGTPKAQIQVSPTLEPSSRMIAVLKQATDSNFAAQSWRS
jgi:hypothetical protein